jgi:tRNA threonylcarbamoyladenosine biosynthesis protein TsaE
MKLTICTTSAEQTTALGERLGKHLKPGDVIALFGDLGAGKTTLTRGIAVGLGLDADIHSPTFTLIHEHPGPTPLYHVDLYRLSHEEEVETLGLEEYIYSDGVTIIEWADRMQTLLPSERLDITLRMITDTDRELIFETQSERLAGVIEEVSRQPLSPPCEGGAGGGQC